MNQYNTSRIIGLLNGFLVLYLVDVTLKVVELWQRYGCVGK